MPQPLTEKDLPKIRKEMQKIMRKNLPFVREEVSAAEARTRIEARHTPAGLRVGCRGWPSVCGCVCGCSRSVLRLALCNLPPPLLPAPHTHGVNAPSGWVDWLIDQLAALAAWLTGATR